MKIKITDKTFNKNIDQIEPGELFIVRDSNDDYNLFDGFFMKIKDEKGSKNAVKINDGQLYYINSNVILQVVNGELTV